MITSSSQLAFRSAILWAITGDIRYAEKSKSIINAWSPVLKDLVGGYALLMAAWYDFGLVNAAEILRYTDSRWQKEDVKRAENMFVNVFYRLNKNWKRGRAGNWDTAITKTMMGIAVFIEDKEMFNRAVDFYISTTEKSNGTLMKYIYDSGQCFESARDQNHAQMGLSGLAFACEIAWKQGIDLYSYDNHRFLRGFEYTAGYNLGDDNLPKPFVANAYGETISTIARGQFAPTYEIILNHYVNRLKYKTDKLPFTHSVVESVRRKRKEGEYGNDIISGYGTLLFNQKKSF